MLALYEEEQELLYEDIKSVLKGDRDPVRTNTFSETFFLIHSYQALDRRHRFKVSLEQDLNEARFGPFLFISDSLQSFPLRLPFKHLELLAKAGRVAIWVVGAA